MLGFRKEVLGLKDVVETREAEVGRLLDQRRELRRKIEMGRRLVDYDERLKELERDLVIETAGREPIIIGEEVSDSDEDEDNDEDKDEYSEGTYGISIAKLRRTVAQYCVILELKKSLEDHPFVAAQASRTAKVRSTLLIDMSTALQQAKSAGASGVRRVMKVMEMYASMEECAEAVKVLRSFKA